MRDDFLQYGILIAWSVGMWLYGRIWHQEGSRNPRLNRFIKAPEWLIFLCGRPRADGRLELAGIVFQLVMLLDLLVILALVTSASAVVRATIFWSLQIAAIILAFVVRIVAYFSKRFRE